MTHWKFIAIVLSYVVFCEGASDYEDTACNNNGIPGVCKYVTDCPLAISMLRTKHRHEFKRCAWDGKMELVCCPQLKDRSPGERNNDDKRDKDEFVWTTTETPDQGDRFKKRKCEQACEEISKETKCIHFNIINGEDAEEGEFPHMAALGYEEEDAISWECGASIISNKFLLSAAHCFIKSVKPTKVRVGVLKASEPAELLDVKRYKTHDKYDHVTKHNDIALIEVEQVIEFTKKVYPACLYWRTEDPTKHMWVTGWGKTSIDQEDDRSITLQKTKMIAVPISKCNQTYVSRTLNTKTIQSTQVCAKANASDACAGDSGGPLQVENHECTYSIVGVISYGMGCGGKVPGVFTRVSMYLDWIESYVWP